MWLRWCSTVFLAMTSTSAISSLVWPSATSLTISTSRGVSGSVGVASPRLGAVEVVADERRDGGRVEEGLAAHGRAAGLDEVAVGGALEHVARRAGLERLEEVLLAVVHREHQRAQLGAPALELARRLEPGLPGHRDVEDRQVDVELERLGHRLAPVAGLADDREVGLGVEHHAQTAQDDRVVVGEQDPRRQRGASRRALGERDVEADLGPAGRIRRDRQARADVQRALLHAGDAGAGGLAIGGQAAAVVAHDQAQAAVDVAQGDEHLRGAGVAHHVGQALLGDAVDHELDLGAHGVLELELALDAHAVVGRRRGAQRAQGALQAEVVEHLGAQLAGDAAHVVEAAAHGLAGRGELGRVVLAGAARPRARARARRR